MSEERTTDRYLSISEKVQVTDPCLINFEPAQRPSAAELVVVYINGERLAAGSDTWALKQPGNTGVEFLGSTCQRIKSSSLRVMSGAAV